MTPTEVIQQFGGAARDWRRGPAGSWIHCDAVVTADAQIMGPAIVRRGQVRRGRIYGGVIHGGWIYGGEIYGGWIYGGEIYGGEIYGGRIYDGEIYGGRVYGGRIYGGVTLGGSIFSSPILIVRLVPWPINVSHPQRKWVSVGCETHEIRVWRRELRRYMEWYKIESTPRFEADAMAVLARCEQWCDEQNPWNI